MLAPVQFSKSPLVIYVPFRKKINKIIINNLQHFMVGLSWTIVVLSKGIWNVLVINMDVKVNLKNKFLELFDSSWTH